MSIYGNLGQGGMGLCFLLNIKLQVCAILMCRLEESN